MKTESKLIEELLKNYSPIERHNLMVKLEHAKNKKELEEILEAILRHKSSECSSHNLRKIK